MPWKVELTEVDGKPCVRVDARANSYGGSSYPDILDATECREFAIALLLASEEIEPGGLQKEIKRLVARLELRGRE